MATRPNTIQNLLLFLALSSVGYNSVFKNAVFDVGRLNDGFLPDLDFFNKTGDDKTTGEQNQSLRSPSATSQSSIVEERPTLNVSNALHGNGASVVVKKSESALRPAIISLDQAYQMSNMHENFPLSCGQQPDWLHPAIKNTVDLVHNGLPPEQKRAGYGFGHGNHGGGVFSIANLVHEQVCMYDVLEKWAELALKLNISRWTAHGGAAISAKCHAAMNPWDDDIDLTVGDCTSLDEAWEKGRNVTEAHPDILPSQYEVDNKDVKFEARLLDNDLILTKGSRCCSWYKLMTVEQARQSTSADIMGIDLECVSRRVSSREIAPKRNSRWLKYLASNRPLDTVTFGPTTIKLMPPRILDRYIKLRYGKDSPCIFPFENGQDKESFILSPKNKTSMVVGLNQYTESHRHVNNMDFAIAHWYIPNKQRARWRARAGSRKQVELTNRIPNLNKVEIDNSIAPAGACDWSQNQTLRAIGFNAERGKYWDLFSNLVHRSKELKEPHVILMNEMDIGMARSFNVHTARRLALELGMNFAWGLEFVELTRGNEEEQNLTRGKRDALGLHGNAILSKCFIGDAMILRDPLPPGYFADKPVRGVNAKGFEVRLGGRMGLFARIYHQDPSIGNGEEEQYYTVGNVHKIAENTRNRQALWDYFGFGTTPPLNKTLGKSAIYADRGVGPVQQIGVVMQGDYGPNLCALGGLARHGGRKDKTFPVKCSPRLHRGVLAGDYFCTDQVESRQLVVTPGCYYPQNTRDPTILIADHAIVSMHFNGTRSSW